MATSDPAVGHVSGDHLIGPVMDLEMAQQRLQQFQKFIKEYMIEGEDYGTIPGTPKPTLLKPGADKLCELYGLADDYQVVQRTEDYDKGLFDYEVKCIITSKRGGFLVSTGLGSCNSYEKKYRWRDSSRKCPNCGKECIIKGRDEYGGGWLCFAKKGGCGAKFTDGDAAIEKQTIGRVQNEDVADLKNTILKMAKKRAKIDATLSATRSSGVFTQDVDEWDLPKDDKPKSDQQAQTETKTTPAQQQQQQQQAKRTPPKPSAPPIKPAMYENVLHCEVKEVFERKSRDGKGAPYLLVVLRTPWEGHANLFNFHGSLFPAIKGAEGQVCRFVTAPGRRDTILIEGIRDIDGKPFVKPEVPAQQEQPKTEQAPADNGWQMHALKGSNLIGAGWKAGILRCAFTTKDGPAFHLFSGVPEDKFQGLLRVPYPDKYFSTSIKGKFEHLGKEAQAA